MRIVVGIPRKMMAFSAPTTSVTPEILDEIYNGAAIPTAEK